MTKGKILPSFAVVPDTNVLFAKDPTKLISPQFQSIWSECKKVAKMRLIIPEVVKGERLYQVMSVAQKSVANAEKNFETISKICGFKSGDLPAPEVMRAGAEAQFDNWMKEVKAVIADIPYSRIDWKRIVNDSIWRVKPFMPAPDGDDSEKGFRDCLILETVFDLAQRLGDEQLIFISNDTTLREATISRCGPAKLAAYEDIIGLESYLKLAIGEANSKFAQAVMQQAPGIFFSPNNPECVFTKCNVVAHIKEKFGPLLDSPIPPNVPTESSSIPVSDERVTIESTELLQFDAPYLKWRTGLRFVRLFRNQHQDPLMHRAPLASLAWLFETVRIQPFDIYWHSKITADATFEQVELNEVKAGRAKTESGALKQSYGFPDP